MLRKRLRDLVPLQCDVFEERQSISESMGKNKPEEEPPVFDVNRRRGTTVRFSNYDPQDAVYRALRLSEMGGIPPSKWAEVLRKAAEEMSDWNLEKAVRLIMRAGIRNNDRAHERVLSRTHIATLPTEQANSLSEACLRIIDRALLGLVVATLQPRTETAIEVLSRLAIRVSPDLAESILNRAMEYCQNTQLAKGTWGKEIQHLLQRSWEALPEEYRRRRALDLLNTPIAGLDSPAPFMEYEWPDPAGVLTGTNTALQRTLDDEQQWQTAVAMVARGLNGDITARNRAGNRMIPLVLSNQLTEDESLEIAHALWSSHHTSQDGLPANTELFDWVFLTLPEPSPGLARDRFRTKWFSNIEGIQWQHKRTIEIIGNSTNVNHDTRDLDSRLWQIGRAMLSLRSRGERLTLSDAEEADIQELVAIWADAATPGPSPTG